MPKHRVEDGRLIRHPIRADYSVELEGNGLSLLMPNVGFVRVFVKVPRYTMRLRLVIPAVRGMIDRLGFPPPRWEETLQRFVDRWSRYPLNYTGDPALEQNCNGMSVIASLRNPKGITGIEVELRMYTGNLVHGGSEIIHEPETLERLGISPFPLGRDPDAVYRFLHHFLTDVVNHAVHWQADEIHNSLEHFLKHYTFGRPEPEAPREWEGVMGNT